MASSPTIPKYSADLEGLALTCPAIYCVSSSSEDEQNPLLAPVIQLSPVSCLETEDPPAIFVLSSDSDLECAPCTQQEKTPLNFGKGEGDHLEALISNFNMVLTRAMATERWADKEPAEDPTLLPLQQGATPGKDAKAGEATGPQYQVTRRGPEWEERRYGKKSSGHYVKKYVCLFPTCYKVYTCLEFFNHHRIRDHPSATIVPPSKKGRFSRFMQSSSSPTKSGKLDVNQYAKKYGMVVKASVKVETILQRACKEHATYYVAKKDAFIRNYVSTGFRIKGVAGRRKYPVIDECTRYDGCSFCMSSDIGLEFEEHGESGGGGQEFVTITSDMPENTLEINVGPHGTRGNGAGCNNLQPASTSDDTIESSREIAMGSSTSGSDWAEQQVRVVGKDIFVERGNCISRPKYNARGRASSASGMSSSGRRQRRVV